MSEKDFLSQFSEKKVVPESFKQEERKPVSKPKKPVNKTLIIILCVLALILGIVAYFVFFAPKIEMPNFERQTKDDVAAWVKQQGIETSGIIFDEDYYFDYDEGTIISQSVEAGKKVKENVKITFVSSLGADPDELITVPDLMSMTKTEIQEWISDYKLTKTKVTTAYSDTVETGNVISFAFSGCEEDTFTRSSTLKIQVSKGVAPAGTIALEDFTKKTYDYVSSWATTKKVTLTKTEQYSDTVEKGYIISQSIASGQTMKETDTLNVVVSKGKAVTIADFTDMDETAISRWCSKNGVTAFFTSQYSDETKGLFVSCNPKANTVIASGDSIDIVISLGNPNIPTGITTETELLEWIDEANIKGADLTPVKDESTFSDSVAAGDLIKYETQNDCGDRVHYSVSRGKNIWVEDYKDASGNIYCWNDLKKHTSEEDTKWNTLTEEEVRTLLSKNGITNYIIEYQGSTTVDINKVISATRSDTNKSVQSESYLPGDVTVTIAISTSKLSS